MKRFTLFGGLFMLLALASCNNDPCMVGNWTWTNTVFICGTNVTFNGGGSGTMVITDCANQCPESSTDQSTRYNLTWSLVSDSVLTVTFSNQGTKCGNPYTFTGNEVIQPITGTVVCEGDQMTYQTSSILGNLQFTRN